MLDLIVEFFSLGLNTLDSARENEIRLHCTSQLQLNRAESIVVGSLIISSCFNHEFVVTYTKFHWGREEQIQ